VKFLTSVLGYIICDYKTRKELREKQKKKNCRLWVLSDTVFIRNEWYTHFQDRVWIHCNWQIKPRSTKEKMESPEPMKAEQAWYGSHYVACDS